MSDAIVAALSAAESFILGFEGDELQEGIPELLAAVRAAKAEAEAALKLERGAFVRADLKPAKAVIATADAASDAEERRAARLQELYEIADGAYGDDAATRGRARVAIAKAEGRTP